MGEEAAAGGKSTTKAVDRTTQKNVPVAKDGAKEAADFATRLKGAESKMIQAKDANQKIMGVAQKLSADLHRATVFVNNKVGAAPGVAHPTKKLAPESNKVEAPTLAESNAALFGTKKQSLGEASDLKMVGPLAKLASAVEADAKHDIWSKEIKADKLSQKVKKEAGKIVADLLSEEVELGEASILHDMTAKTKTVTLSPLDSEKMTLASSQALEKVAKKEHQAQVTAESQTRLLAEKFTALKKDLSKHASQLGSTHELAEGQTWVQNDVSLLNEMTTEAQRIAEVEKLK